jgi:hypothetical protein
MPPPLLVGREAVLEHARLAFARFKAGRGEKSVWLSGLRGSGRTVLLSALRGLADEAGIELKAVDEAQSLPLGELKALLAEQEANLAQQRARAVVLAGLPLDEVLDDGAHALAARLFTRFDLDALSADEAARALQAPAQALGVTWQAEALHEAQRQSRGFPAFVQAWAYEAWNRAAGPAITRDDLRACAEAATRRLDADFYGPGFARLSPREKAYLRTMAHLGPGPHRSGDIADSMDAKITSLGPLRAKLIDGGWVYSPSHGMLGFAAPGFDEFMRRVMPGFR